MDRDNLVRRVAMAEEERSRRSRRRRGRGRSRMSRRSRWSREKRERCTVHVSIPNGHMRASLSFHSSIFPVYIYHPPFLSPYLRALANACPGQGATTPHRHRRMKAMCVDLETGGRGRLWGQGNF